MVKLDGGSGIDTLSFGNMGTQGSTELTLSGGGATNFESIDGSGALILLEVILTSISSEVMVVLIRFMAAVETILLVGQLLGVALEVVIDSRRQMIQIVTPMTIYTARLEMTS